MISYLFLLILLVLVWFIWTLALGTAVGDCTAVMAPLVCSNFSTSEAGEVFPYQYIASVQLLACSLGKE
jgi:hypothetical protein